VTRPVALRCRPAPPAQPHAAVGLVVHYDPARGDGLVVTADGTYYCVTAHTCGIDFTSLQPGNTVECHAVEGGERVSYARVLAKSPIHPLPRPGSLAQLAPSPSTFVSPRQRSQAILDAAQVLADVERSGALPYLSRDVLRELLRCLPSKAELV
jgi:hypothetical protein